MTSSKQYSILFVCYGNICRSPMGEAIFDHLAKKAGVRDQWLVDSAATSGHEAGSWIYSTAQKVLRKYSINYEHTARKIEPGDYHKYELILGFDDRNIKDLERMKPSTSKAEIRLVNYFNPNPKKRNESIADPWYPDTLEAFEEVYQDCLDSCKAIIDKYK